MLNEIRRVFQIPELKSKILLTLAYAWLFAALVDLFRFRGLMVKLLLAFSDMRPAEVKTFQMVDIFSGGAFSQMTVIALGVIPYISASIIMQLLVALSALLATRNARK